MLAPVTTKEQEWTIKAFNTIWDHNIMMTVGGALAILQPLRNHFQEMVMPKQITNANMATISEIPDDGTNDALPYPGKSLLGTYTFHSNANTHNASIMELTGTFGAVDPVEAFYSHWPPEHCASLCVTKDTDSLRAIMAVINRKKGVECIVDSGSQIVSMLEEIVHQMGLVYDSTVMLNMQSANGMIDQSQGLARNVPCTIVGLTIYLQVHIISQPAYDILLGKPFNVLTHSIVRTLSANETVSTITNPNGVLTANIFKANIPKHKGVQMKKKYKPVTLKVKPVAGTVPEDFGVERNIKEDPLADMLLLDPNLPPFTPTEHFTEERKNQFLKEHDTGFLHADELNI
ncbi:hypothetical protein C0995_013376 [Termitomyces sp. Mi166|nr:hypothetical protein C0995_013376 [Termitomyces sp. Mi166\